MRSLNKSNLSRNIAVLFSLCMLLTIFTVHTQAEDTTKVKDTFKVLTYNVAGLRDFKPTNQTQDAWSNWQIGARLSVFDIVGVQENFDNDLELSTEIRLPYRTDFDGRVMNGDGLDIFSKFRIHSTFTHQWFYRFGSATNVNDNHGADQNTPKGFMVTEVEIAPGKLIHVYNLHADAGHLTSLSKNSGSNWKKTGYNNGDEIIDEGSVNARGANIRQLAEHIRKYSQGKAVIVMGDTNAYHFRDTDYLQEALVDGVGLTDAMIELNRGGVYPTPVSNWYDNRVWEKDLDLDYVRNNPNYEAVDKIFYRSGDDVKLTALNFKDEHDLFSYKGSFPITYKGQTINNLDALNRLSDHYPWSVEFEYEVDHDMPDEVYLSDMKCDYSFQGWTNIPDGSGLLKADAGFGGPLHYDRDQMRINGVRYSKGLGTHANSHLIYSIDGKYKTFKSVIGLDDRVGGGGSVTYEVHGDGRLLYSSELLNGNSNALPISVDVTGVNKLELKVWKNGDNSNDYANWADARLLTTNSPVEYDYTIVNDTDPSIKYYAPFSDFSHLTRNNGDINGDVTQERSWISYDMSANLYNPDETYNKIKGYYRELERPYIEYTFTGTGIDYIGPKDQLMGAQYVYIDGKLVKQINNHETYYWGRQTLFSIKGLPYGQHTIRIEKVTGEYIILDAFKVYGKPLGTSEMRNSYNLPDLYFTQGNWGLSLNRNMGDLNNDVQQTQDDGASFKYYFYGTGISFVGPKNDTLGDFDVWVDGQYKGRYSAHASTYIPQQELFKITGLGKVNYHHVLEVKQVTGRYIVLDGFKVYNPYNQPIAKTETRNSTNLPGLTWLTGNWGLSRNRNMGDLGNDVQQTQDDGASFIYYFKGTGVGLIGPKNNTIGDFDVWIDGQYKGRYSANASSYQPQKELFKITGLPKVNYHHTIEVKQVTGRYIVLDGFKVYDPY